MYKTMITTAELAANIDNPNWLVVDASYELKDKSAGYSMYQAAHIQDVGRVLKKLVETSPKPYRKTLKKRVEKATIKALKAC